MKPIVFLPFDGCQPVRVYRRHLPHWHQDGATYFVTFRLADSIPRAVLERWQEERCAWLLGHGLTDDLPEALWKERYRAIPEPERHAFEHEQAKNLFHELDRCHGECLLRGPEAAAIVAEALGFFDGQRLRCGDYVVMPNHVHWLVQPASRWELEDLLQSVKRFAAAQINRQSARRGHLWQKENHDHIVRDEHELVRTREYIAANPGKAGLSGDAVRRLQAEWVQDTPK